MKITKSQLKQLIKEELEQSIDEAWDSAGNWKSRYSNRQDVEPETDEERKYRREKEAREDERRREAGLPPIKSKYFEEQEQLDEGAMGMIVKALQSPQAKEILQNMILPMIQQAIADKMGGAPAE
jgi:hypothetical protein